MAKQSSGFRARLRQALSAGRLNHFLGDRSGNVLMFVALGVPVIFGMAGLGLDVSIWYLEKRQNQTVADNAALTAIMELEANPNLTDAQLLQKIWEDANRNGYDDTATRDIIVNRPPTSGAFTAPALGAVEVLVREQRPLYLAAAVMGGSEVTIEGRAVGQLTATGSHCILSLHPTMDDALEVVGTADADIDCGVAANSSSDTAIGIYGNADLTADPAQAFGDIYVSSNATLTTNSPAQPLSQRIDDPYYDHITTNSLMPPLSGACNSNDLPVEIKKQTNPNTLTPNYPSGDINAYCGGLSISALADVTLLPGIYVIDDGDFSVAGSATVQGAGVTIILTAWQPGNKVNEVGNIVIGGGASVTLSAPTTGLYAGLLFIQDPAAPTAYASTSTPTGMEQNTIQGGTDMNLTGAIYAPTREVRFAGGAGSASGGSACTQVIASKVTIAGNSVIENDAAACANAGVTNMAQTRIRVVE